MVLSNMHKKCDVLINILSFTGDNYINLTQKEVVTERDSIGGEILLQNCS